MAQKNFSAMSTKKLNSLLETANDEDRVLIQEVLNKRNGVSAPATEAPTVETEEAPVAEAPTVETEEAPVAEAKSTKLVKLTDEERHNLAEELRATVLNHRCEVVPFNTVEWVPGTVIGIIEEKRNNKVMYAVKTDDGRRIVKAYGTNLLRINEETVEPAKRGRSNKATQLDENGNPIEKPVAQWLEEEIEAAVNAVIDNVGKTVSYPKTAAFGTIFEGEGEGEGEVETGRIVSLVPNKRQKTMLYRIEVDQPEGADKKKYAHKVTSNESLVLAEELDEVGTKINEAYKARYYNRAESNAALTPEEAFKAAEASLNTAKERLERQKETVAKREKLYNEAKAAYEASLVNSTSDEDTSAVNSISAVSENEVPESETPASAEMPAEADELA